MPKGGSESREIEYYETKFFHAIARNCAATGYTVNR